MSGSSPTPRKANHPRNGAGLTPISGETDMLRISKRTALLASLLGLAFGSGMAQAGNNYGVTLNTFTGAQCQPSTGTQWGDFLVNPDGIRNISTSNRYISCTGLANWTVPTAQGDADVTTPSGEFNIWMSFDYSTVAATGSFTTNCTFFRRNMSTGVSQSATIGVTSGKTTTPVLQLFTPSVYDGTNPNNWEGISFNCRLPPQVKFLGFTQVNRSSEGGYYYTP